MALISSIYSSNALWMNSLDKETNQRMKAARKQAKKKWARRSPEAAQKRLRGRRQRRSGWGVAVAQAAAKPK